MKMPLSDPGPKAVPCLIVGGGETSPGMPSNLLCVETIRSTEGYNKKVSFVQMPNVIAVQPTHLNSKNSGSLDSRKPKPPASMNSGTGRSRKIPIISILVEHPADVLQEVVNTPPQRKKSHEKIRLTVPSRKTSLERIREMNKNKLQVGQIKRSRKTSINRIMEQTFTLSNGTTRNKNEVNKFVELVKQVVKALSGHDYIFVQQAEFYPDLKETLHKIYSHIHMCGNRQKVVQLVMTKKDKQFYDEMRKHVDALCGRIFLAYACRMTTRKKCVESSQNMK